jgi:hypothetical protein
MDWGPGRLADFAAPDDIAEIAAATGAMLVGRRTWEVGNEMEAEEPGSGPFFVLTHVSKMAVKLIPSLNNMTVVVHAYIKRRAAGFCCRHRSIRQWVGTLLGIPNFSEKPFIKRAICRATRPGQSGLRI